MKYYIIAGEASGDLHGGNLIRGLKKSDPEAEFRFWGGDAMAEAGGGANLARHYKTASFMGFVEVLRNLRTIFGQMKECKRDIAAYRPDVVILIDYAGFNLPIAKFAHEAGFKVFYYISPKVWVWKEGRVETMRKYCDEIFIIFPFEVDFFRSKGIVAIYEGNPISDVVAQRLAALPSEKGYRERWRLDERPIVALLAGSRKSEIRYNLPFMATVSAQFPDYQFVVAAVPWLDRSLYDEAIAGTSVKYVCDATYPTLAFSKAAMVTSGTATLETALVGIPEMVCYRADPISVRIARYVAGDLKFISLVNLILGREAVRELIQEQMKPLAAAEVLRSILPGGARREKMMADFEELRRLVGGPGASDRVAARMVEKLRIEN